MATWAKETRVKLLGGELIYRAPFEQYDSMRLALEGVKRRAHDLRTPFGAFRPRWQELIRQNFARQGLITPWPALSPAYAAWKQKYFPGKTILRRTDRLYNSLASTTADTIWEVAPRTVRFGSRVPWFAVHQRGGRNMPARPPLILTADSFGEMNMEVMRYVTDPLKNTGGLRG